MHSSFKRFAQSFLCLSLLLSGSAMTAKKCCNKRSSNRWDYVIVGAGTSGSALAAKLSDPDADGKFRTSVLVIEAGENLTDSPLVLVNNIFSALANSNNPLLSTVEVSNYQTGNPFATFYYLQGRMWGGSAGHNYLATVRGTPDGVYNQWAALSGDARWSYNNLLTNVMLPMEHYTPDGTVANPAQRGSNGPLFITQEPPLDTDALAQAISTATGAPLISDYNDPSLGDVGVSANQDWVTPPYLGANSHRSFVGNAYLTGDASVGTPAIVDADGRGLNGRKLQIISNAHANRVIFNKKKTAKGVEYVFSDAKEKVFFAKARKGVILSAGALYDPAILQRSGIGDPTLLESLGIPVVFANSNVGQHLQTHTSAVGVIGDVTTINLPRVGEAFYGFAPNTDVREMQTLFLNTVAGLASGIRDALGITEGVEFLGTNVTPHSEGDVAIVSTNPFIDPQINFNLYSDGGFTDPGSDANKIVNFYHILQDIATEAGGTVLYPPAADYIAGDAALFADALNTIVINEHAARTCRMAQTAATGVVDGSLAVFGVNNLWVASNAVVPVINDGNTSYTADVIGLEAARILRGE